MSGFTLQLINRSTFPNKHILICEDDIHNQMVLLTHFRKVFSPQGEVQVSVVPGGMMAAALMQSFKIDLIILDHDMPFGNGVEFLTWMKENNLSIPVITASGIDSNNDRLMDNGATYKFSKDQVSSGKADETICGILGISGNLYKKLRFGMDLDGNLDTPEIVELSNILFDAGHEIYIVTGGMGDYGEWTVEERVKKLNRLGVKYTEIIRCLKPNIDEIGIEKGRVCKELGIKLLFDDSQVFVSHARKDVQCLWTAPRG